MIIYLSLLICLIGLVVYAPRTRAEWQAVALHMFWVGLLVFLFVKSTTVVGR